MIAEASLVRIFSILAFAAQSVFLLSIGTIDDVGSILFVLALGSGLLMPLLMVRASKPQLSLALGIGLGVAALGFVWIASDSLGGTNSTAALGFMLVPPFQWISIGIAAAIGYAVERDKTRA